MNEGSHGYGKHRGKPLAPADERTVTGIGRAKLLLFGEHAAVYGYPAVGLPLNEKLGVSLRIDGQPVWGLRQIEPEASERLETILEWMEAESPEIGQVMGAWGRGTVEVESSIPVGLGFGSSAALCVALSEALENLVTLFRTGTCREEQESGGIGRSAERLSRVWLRAHGAEGIFHGTPSGIDTGLSILGGLHQFKPNPPDLPWRRRIETERFFLVVGATPRAKNCGALIGELGERMRSGDALATDRLERLGSIAEKAISIFESRRSGWRRRIGALATDAHSLLRDLNLSSPEIEQMLKRGLAAGALGGKLSGAGGGGAFFLWVDDEEKTRRLADELRMEAKKSGMGTWTTIHPVIWEEERHE
jgi:mevalonate kinase